MRSIKFNDFWRWISRCLNEHQYLFLPNTESGLMVDMEFEGILLSINTLKNAVVFVICITMPAVLLFGLFVVNIYSCQI